MGTHKVTGFASGTIDGQKANLILRKGLITIDNPNIDYVTALSEDSQTLFIVLLNNQAKTNKFNLIVDTSQLGLKSRNQRRFEDEISSFGYHIISVKL
ncbi:MAG: hypothetical protein VB126_04335 [Paludibacter sp.]|nr:hypothetical protein [Paludibacter sp.]